jgi:hypothetical protein
MQLDRLFENSFIDFVSTHPSIPHRSAVVLGRNGRMAQTAFCNHLPAGYLDEKHTLGANVYGTHSFAGNRYAAILKTECPQDMLCSLLLASKDVSPRWSPQHLKSRRRDVDSVEIPSHLCVDVVAFMLCSFVSTVIFANQGQGTIGR